MRRAALLAFALSAPAQAQTLLVEGTVTCSAGRLAVYTYVFPANHKRNGAVVTESGHFSIPIPKRDVVTAGTATIVVLGKGGRFREVRPHIRFSDLRRAGRLRLSNEVDTRYECGEIVETVGAVESARTALIANDSLFPPQSRGLKSAGAVPLAGLLARFLLLGVAGAGAPGAPVIDSTHVEQYPANDYPLSQPLFRTGHLLDYGFAPISQTVGFTFAPVSRLGEAPIWNPSAADDYQPGQVGSALGLLGTEPLSSHWSGGLYIPVSEHFSMTVGIRRLRQTGSRSVAFHTDTLEGEFGASEWLGTVGIAMRATPSFAVSLAPTFYYQAREAPRTIIRTVDYRHHTNVPGFNPLPPDSVVTLALEGATRHWSRANATFAATLHPVPTLTIGVTVLNLLGGHAPDGTGTTIPMRRIGVGANMELGRFLIGGELMHGPRTTNSAVGVSVAARPGLTVAAGFSSAFATRNASFSYHNFTYSYNRSRVFGARHELGTRLTSGDLRL